MEALMQGISTCIVAVGNAHERMRLCSAMQDLGFDTQPVCAASQLSAHNPPDAIVAINDGSFAGDQIVQALRAWPLLNRPMVFVLRPDWTTEHIDALVKAEEDRRRTFLQFRQTLHHEDELAEEPMLQAAE